MSPTKLHLDYQQNTALKMRIQVETINYAQTETLKPRQYG